MIDKDAIVKILMERLDSPPCKTCYKLSNNIPDCHECNPRLAINDDYAREIANEIIRKGVKQQ